MKNSNYSIKTIFIKKMGYSALLQFIAFAFILLLFKNYTEHDKLNNLTDSLIINDPFTLDEIKRYLILGNKYALDLELFNIENGRKLDSIKFIRNLTPLDISTFGTCEFFYRKNKICRGTEGQFTGITTVKHNNKTLGFIISKKTLSSFFNTSTSSNILLIFIIVIGVFIFNFIFLFLSMRKKIASTTQHLLHFISNHQNNLQIDNSNIDIYEYKIIANKFIENNNAILKMQNERAYYEARKNIAEQVAHDIRSPLAAINTAILNVPMIPEKKRTMIRNASKRINDIANNLLIQSKNNDNNCHEETIISAELIYILLEHIVAEKRYEHARSKIEINLHGANNIFNCFSNIHLSSFKRVLSNLINNSFESIQYEGSININLKCIDNDTICIEIQDNGCGIPDHIMPKIAEQGFSYNKKNGAGFGLFYAKQYIESLNGLISINSKIHIGTTISIQLRSTPPPEWFCNALNIQSNLAIAVLDDDPSIHETWEDRLSPFSKIKIFHYTKSSQLCIKTINDSNINLYLVDYELLNDIKNGIDFIEEFNLIEKSILVTSCFEEISLRNRCMKLGLKIIPKNYVPYIPIQIESNMSAAPSYILIDDDEMMRTTWKFAAENAGTNIDTFSSISSFREAANRYPKDSVIYVDSNLGNNIKGEIFAKELYSLGFTEIYLCTGKPKDEFRDIYWIKDIVDKYPPFTKIIENSL